MSITDPNTATDEATPDPADRVRRREPSAVLRMSEAEAALIGSDPAPGDDDRVLLNMGPAHPSTHGVLRLMLELEGETVCRSKPVIGYLHTGMEKTAAPRSPPAAWPCFSPWAWAWSWGRREWRASFPRSRRSCG